MVGFISGDPFSSVAVEQQGLADLPSTLGEAVGSEFSGGFASSFGPRIGRSLDRAGMSAFDPEGIGSSLPGSAGEGGAVPGMADTGPMLDPAAANAKYGIGGGVLNFTQPVSDAAAADLYQAKHADLLRQDIQNRAPNSFGVRTAASFAGSLMDPTNLALGLIPGVPEAAVADRLGGGLLAGIAGRAVEGATAGAAGMAAAEPLNYLLDNQEHTDWSMSQALRDVAFGGLLGGGLHTALGGFAERPARVVSDRIEAAGPEARETLLQGSLGQMMDDRPITAAPALDAFDADQALSELRTWSDQQQRIDADSDAALQASQVPDAPDMSAQIGAASDQLNALQATAEGFRSDIARSQETTLRAAMDPATSDRLGEVETELNTVIPSSRRADLERERTMLLEGRNAGRDIQSAGGDLDVARGQAETQGLQVAGARAQAAADQAQAALQRLQDQDAQARGIQAGQQQSADRAFGIQSARLASREDVVQALATRTIRRLAGRAGVALEDGQADALARGVLREGLDPAEAVAAVVRRKQEVGSITPDTIAGNVPTADGAAAGDPVAALQEYRTSALNDLRAASLRDDPERAAVSANADHAASASSGSLADVQSHIAELEQRYRPEPAGDGAAPGEAAGSGDLAIDAAQAGVDEAEQRAGAVQQAAACLARSGL